MVHHTLKKAFQLLAAGGFAALIAGAQPLAQAERDYAVRYLTESRNGVADAVKGLSEAQWKFKPVPDRWSIAEIVEHLAVTEDLVSKKVLVDLPAAPAPSASHNARQVDALVLAKMNDRSVKAQAPPQIVPTGRWSPSGALQHLLDSRAQTIALFEAMPDPRHHVIDHPAFGPLDGYEWVLVVAAHSARHTQQILEVKSDPNFPVK